MSPQAYTLDSLSVDVCAMAVPLGECIYARPGPVGSETVARMAERGFSQAPVVEYIGGSAYPGDYVLGLIPRDRLQQLADSGQDLRADDQGITPQAEANPGISLGPLLDMMMEHSAVIVNAISYRTVGPPYDPFGLLTRSDLNKHPMRAPIYTLLAHLEDRLAGLVRRSYPGDPWATWISKLNPENQVRVLGYWELSKRRGVDIGPVAGTTLTDLLTVVERDAVLLERLRYPSRSQFKQRKDDSIELRNQVMHPVRLLVTEDADSCRCLKERLNAVVELSERLEDANP